jgi:hypothetical protein
MKQKEFARLMGTQDGNEIARRLLIELGNGMIDPSDQGALGGAVHRLTTEVIGNTLEARGNTLLNVQEYRETVFEALIEMLDAAWPAGVKNRATNTAK